MLLSKAATGNVCTEFTTNEGSHGGYQGRRTLHSGTTGHNKSLPSIFVRYRLYPNLLALYYRPPLRPVCGRCPYLPSSLKTTTIMFTDISISHNIVIWWLPSYRCLSSFRLRHPVIQLRRIKLRYFHRFFLPRFCPPRSRFNSLILARAKRSGTFGPIRFLPAIGFLLISIIKTCLQNNPCSAFFV